MKNQKPGSGFSLKKEAAAGNDAYNNYSQATDNAEIFDMLLSEGGRQTIRSEERRVGKECRL